MTTAKEITDRITWQPIETAPKNVKVLAAYQNELGNWRIVTACYHTQLDWSEEYGDHEEDFAPEAWYEESDSSEVIYPTSRVPTHWMPLPSNPSATDDNILLSALADAERERDEANERCAAAVEDYNVQLAGHHLSAKQSTENLIRATAAESTLEEARKVLEPFAKAADLDMIFNDATTVEDTRAADHITLGNLRAAMVLLAKLGASHDA